MPIERRRGDQPKQAAVDPVAARRLFTAPTTSALALLVAAQRLLGEDFIPWEPESLWLELEHRGLDVPLPNRAKLLAALALVLVPSFYWDAVVLGKTALAFDHVVPNPDALEEATAAQLAWAAKEAASILARHGDAAREFAHEPAAYAAVVLHREGLGTAPDALAFAQPQLDTIHGADRALRDRVKAAWSTLDKGNLPTHRFAETPMDVQLARLAAVEVHIRDRDAQMSRELAALI